MPRSSCQFIVVVIGNGQFRSVLLEVRQQATVGHVGHHNVGGMPHICAHSNQPHDVWVGELGHFQALLNHAVEIIDTEHTWIFSKTHSHVHWWIQEADGDAL